MKYSDFFETYQEFIRRCPEEEFHPDESYVFLSDLHMGNGSSRDDLERNRELITTLLHWYRENKYILILNGDIEDLSKFSLSVIRRAWPMLYDIFSEFHRAGRLRKITGNHDECAFFPATYPYPLLDGLVLRYGHDRLFVFHGHQSTDRYVRFGAVSHLLIRFLAKPLHINNTSVSKDSRRRYSTEKSIYRAANTLGVVAITGHTHRPLFESLSKFDRIRFTVEELLMEYTGAEPGRKTEIEGEIAMLREEMDNLSSSQRKRRKNQSLYGDSPFLIPCVFNSGSATGKHGITTLEIASGQISLVYWTTGKKTGPYLKKEAIKKTAVAEHCLRYILQSDTLDTIFTRIRLLGKSSGNGK